MHLSSLSTLQDVDCTSHNVTGQEKTSCSKQENLNGTVKNNVHKMGNVRKTAGDCCPFQIQTMNSNLQRRKQTSNRRHQDL